MGKTENPSATSNEKSFMPKALSWDPASMPGGWPPPPQYAPAGAWPNPIATRVPPRERQPEMPQAQAESVTPATEIPQARFEDSLPESIPEPAATLPLPVPVIEPVAAVVAEPNPEPIAAISPETVVSSTEVPDISDTSEKESAAPAPEPVVEAYVTPVSPISIYEVPVAADARNVSRGVDEEPVELPKAA